jgi:diguanylate cyclase (GGDEF)-like protein/PAS domain S-box-containing protein
VVFSGVDVTHRRRAEEELRKSEARLRLLADSATELVSTYEPGSGRLTYASPSWRSLGYDPRRLVGTNVTDLTHPDDLASAATLHARLLAAGDPVTIEARIRTAGGEWRWFEALAHLVRDEEGKATVVHVSSRDVSRRRETEQELVRRALHDPLTGLPNRALFHDRLETALRRAVRQTGKVALLFCDLDRFKLVNDTHGHPAGDAVLRESASRLEAACRPEDTVARLGGDEFVVLAEGVEDESVTEGLAKRIAASLEEPIRWKDVEIVQRVSVGVAIASHAGATVEELLLQADEAMYRVKRARRGPD